MEQVKIHTWVNLYFNKKIRMLHVQCWTNVKVYLKCQNLISVRLYFILMILITENGPQPSVFNDCNFYSAIRRSKRHIIIIVFITYNKMKTKKGHTVGTVPKCTRNTSVLYNIMHSGNETWSALRKCWLRKSLSNTLGILFDWFDLFCLTPLSAIFQL